MTHVATPLEVITTRFSDLAERDVPDEQTLIALAALDPAAATAWLLERDPASLPSRPRLTRFLSAVADSISRSPGAVNVPELLQIVRRFGHLLSPQHATEITGAARTAPVDPALEEALSAALERAPEQPALLRAAAELSVAAGQHARAHELLTRLGRADAGLATMQYVYGARQRLLRTSATPVRVAILSSFTIDTLIPYVDLECRALNLEPHIYVAPFNSWEREMLGEGSGLQRFEPHIVFLAAAADDLIPSLALPDANLTTAGEAAVDRLLAAAERFTSWSSALLVVHGFQSVFRDTRGPASSRVGPSRSEVMNALNARLAEGLRSLPRSYFLDLADLVARRRQGAADNPKLRHLASMRLSEHVLRDLGTAHAQYIAPLMGRTRKCVVLDLDNTLWGGIVGEDGPHGIRLGDTSPGSEFREFQQFLMSLTRKGILLAVNSKNNEADALEVIRSHNAMLLREETFSAMRINWDSKPSNMLSLAAELNIGLDSFVFVDDNEKERALMRQAHPQVLTPEMPKDPARYRETLEMLPELQVLTITDEDRSRTQQYVERRQREQLRLTAQTPEGYLASLEIAAAIETASPRTLPRVHQLFLRTNQFNLTGIRYEPGVLAARSIDSAWRIYTAQVTDRFGDHGLVATAVVRAEQDEWKIENFVMSCRVIGYGIEDALLARVAGDARDADARWLLGEIVTLPKNAPARDFFSRNSFTPDVGENERRNWRRDLGEDGLTAPAWISVRADNGA